MTSFFLNQIKGYIHLGMEIIQMKQQKENISTVQLIYSLANSRQRWNYSSKNVVIGITRNFLEKIKQQFGKNQLTFLLTTQKLGETEAVQWQLKVNSLHFSQ